MREIAPSYEKYLFVCENQRSDGRQSCGRGSELLVALIKEAVRNKALDSRLRVTRSGCVNSCQKGPVALLMPDNILFSEIRASDVDMLLNRVKEIMK